MQTICTSLQADNHTNTSSLNCYRPDAVPDTQPTVSKQRKTILADLISNPTLFAPNTITHIKPQTLIQRE